MKVEKLQMCRLCLVKEVRMYMVNMELQIVFEKLTDIQFVTDDSRPMLACVFCYTKLNQCCLLRRKCLEAEELFTQMLNNDDEIEPLIKQGPVEFVIAPTQTISITDKCQLERNDTKEKLSDDCEGHNDINEIKEEYQTVLENMPTNCPEPDSEDDTPSIEFETEVKIEPVELTNEQRAGETKSAPDTKKPELYVRLTRLEDTIMAQQKKTEQPDSPIIRNTQKRTSTAGPKFNKLVTNYKLISNSVNNTAISMSDRKRTYNCDVCQYSSTRKIYLITHIREHTGEKPYKCGICQKSFSRTDHLKTHSRTHTGEKPYKCETCQKSFNDRRHLKRHVRIHTGEKPYKCETCQKSFNDRRDLKRHVHTHTGEKPYTCQICQKTFQQSCGLRYHVRTHTGEKPYKCQICRKSLTSANYLKQHVRIHTGDSSYKCGICQKSFNYRSNLKRHVRIHTGEKRFKCQICQMSFNRVDVLKQHVLIHTGEKCYKCGICQKSFRHKSTLNSHVRIHTGNKP